MSAREVLDHQILSLFHLSLDDLYTHYRNAEDPKDTTYMAMIYSIGRWRFGENAWSSHQIEFFKKRAREAAWNQNSVPTPKVKSKPLSLEDIGL